MSAHEWTAALVACNRLPLTASPHYLGSAAWAERTLRQRNSNPVRLLLVDKDQGTIERLRAWAERQPSPDRISVVEGDGPSIVDRYLARSEIATAAVFVDPFTWDEHLDALVSSWVARGARVASWYPILGPTTSASFRPLEATAGADSISREDVRSASPGAPAGDASSRRRLARFEIVWGPADHSGMVGAGMVFGPCDSLCLERLRAVADALRDALDPGKLP